VHVLDLAADESLVHLNELAIASQLAFIRRLQGGAQTM
jgi:hypothetical protein